MTWYYFIVMEAMLFHAYSPVDDDIKRYKGLKYKNQLDDLKELRFNHKFYVMADS